MRVATFCTALAAALAAPEGRAVQLNADGLGQALLFPHYTVRTSGDGGQLNTYFSIVNHTASAKALRVRFREARGGNAALSLNVFLGPDDVWTAVLVPQLQGAALITLDASCTDPRPPAVGLLLADAAYAGRVDEAGADGFERAREGFVEVLEMATLNGASAAGASVPPIPAVTLPHDCAAARAPLASDVAAPSGGLSGTLTIINPASGFDLTVNAEALDQLAQRPYFRPPSDPYPAFTAAEIDPVSVVSNGGVTYRSLWRRGVDAVSAVMMRSELQSEFTIEPATNSRTEWVLAFPTRAHYVGEGAAAAPFNGSPWGVRCGGGRANSPISGYRGESINGYITDRRERYTFMGPASNPIIPDDDPWLVCGAAAVIPFHRAYDATSSAAPPTVMGSTAGGFSLPFLEVRSPFESGSLRLSLYDGSASRTLRSEPGSLRFDAASGTAVPGAHTFHGLPVLGFWVRTLSNGTLRCGAGSCQGNYGAAIPFSYRLIVR